MILFVFWTHLFCLLNNIYRLSAVIRRFYRMARKITKTNSVSKRHKYLTSFDSKRKFRIGNEYQTDCPDIIPAPKRRPQELMHYAQIIWSPAKDISDEKLDEYIAQAQRHCYNGEGALRALFRYKHDLDRAIRGLDIFTPFPEDDIRIGGRYQAVCPDLLPQSERNPDELRHNAQLNWSPTESLSDKDLNEFIAVAKEHYGHCREEALLILFRHQCDVDRAVNGLNIFTPFPNADIEIGPEYQAECPKYIPQSERRPEELVEKSLLVWSPAEDIPDVKLDRFIGVAKKVYGYSGEQALGMLFWHKHDCDRALRDMDNFAPFPDEWTDEDKMLFHLAFQVHGKSFHRIQQMLPDKTIASLVKYYYKFKLRPTSNTRMNQNQA